MELTIVKKEKDEFRVYAVYPNEDEEGKVTLWTSHHTWDGKSTITEYMTNIECSAYLDDFDSYTELLNELLGHKVVHWFTDETDIENGLNEIKTGEFGACIFA